LLSPDPTYALQQITNAVNENAALMSWAQSLLNTTLPLLDPQPAWYASINATLASQQAAATDWLNTTGPSTFAALTQSNVDFANLFGVAVLPMGTLVNAINTAGGTPTTTQLSQLVTYVTALRAKAATQSTLITQAAQAMTTYAAQVTSDQAVLATAMTAALAASAQDAVVIQQIQGQIQLLQIQISALGAEAGSSQVSSQTGLFSIVIGMTFELAVAGGVLALGGLAGALVGIGVAAVMNEIYTAEIQATMTQIVTLTQQLGTAEIQLAMVQSVISALQVLTEANQSALQTLNNASNIWILVLAQLDGLLIALAQPQVDTTLMTQLLGLNTDAAVWQRISTFAQQAQGMPMAAQLLDLPNTIITKPPLQLVK